MEKNYASLTTFSSTNEANYCYCYRPADPGRYSLARCMHDALHGQYLECSLLAWRTCNLHHPCKCTFVHQAHGQCAVHQLRIIRTVQSAPTSLLQVAMQELSFPVPSYFTLPLMNCLLECCRSSVQAGCSCCSSCEFATSGRAQSHKALLWLLCLVMKSIGPMSDGRAGGQFVWSTRRAGGR